MEPDDTRRGKPSDGRTVKPTDAQAALDDIRRRREQSGMAELHHGLSRFYLLPAALVVFGAFASFDLPNPWGGAVLFPGIVLLALMAFTYLRRAPVRNKPGRAAGLVAVVCGIVLVAVFQGLAAAFEAGEAPTPHLLAAVVAVGACLLAVPGARRAAAARVRRRAGRRG